MHIHMHMITAPEMWYKVLNMRIYVFLIFWNDSTSGDYASSGRMVVSNKSEGMWKEAVMA